MSSFKRRHNWTEDKVRNQSSPTYAEAAAFSGCCFPPSIRHTRARRADRRGKGREKEKGIIFIFFAKVRQGARQRK